MNAVADGATFTQRWMLENKRTGLFSVTLRTGFIGTCQGKAARRLENVTAVRVVALDTIHFLFQDRMVLGQVKLGLNCAMTLKTGGRIFAGIYYEFTPPPAAGDMETTGTVAGLATGLARGSGVLEMEAGVGTGGEDAGDIGVAFSATPVTQKGCAGDLRGSGKC
jgi:hypothetical protein